MKNSCRLVIFAAIGALLLASLGACGAQPTSTAASTLSGTIAVSGADALYPLMQRWAGEFQKVNPGVKFDISAGGAGKGMTDTLSGAVDIGMISRAITKDEEAKGAGTEPRPNGDVPAEAGCAAPAGEAAGCALCPNPWTNLFVAENGDVLVCFLSVPIGNLYETPISRMWNSPRAMAQRSDMLAGRYLEAGCSPRWCSWREGKKAAPPRSDSLAELRAETALLAGRAARAQSPVPTGDGPSAIAAVRRMAASRDQRIQELEVMFAQLCDNNAAIQERSQEHIAHLEAKAEAAIAEFRKQEQEFVRYRELPLIRAADALSRFLSRLRRAVLP